MQEFNQRFNPRVVDAWVSMWNSHDLSMVDRLFLKDSRPTYSSSEKQDIIKGIEASADTMKSLASLKEARFNAGQSHWSTCNQETSAVLLTLTFNY